MTFIGGDLKDALNKNKDYRHVKWTTGNLQVVLMRLKPNESIPMEIHPLTDQFFYIQSGNIYVSSYDKQRGSVLSSVQGGDGYSFIIPKGTYHEIKNLSSINDLVLFTIYSPPEHAVTRIDHRQQKQNINEAITEIISKIKN